MHRLSPIVTAPEEYLSRAQVAEMFNVSPSTVTRWADQGKLAYIRTLGGHRRYQKNGIIELVRTLTQEEQMEAFTVEVPKMYGDHHVTAVHRALADLPGIHQVQASAAVRQLRVVFEPDSVSSTTILGQLAEAGYPAKNGDRLQVEVTAPGGHQKDPAWAQLGLRMTQTHPADR